MDFKKPLNQLLLILVAVFLLPLVILTAYHISTLNENERVLTEIYDNQLEAILFSVNQYSQDLVDGWAHQLSRAASDSASVDEQIEKFLEENESVSYLLLADSTLQNHQWWTLLETPIPDAGTLLHDSLYRRKAELARLLEYRREGYLRKDPVGQLALDGLPDQSGLLFLLHDPELNYQVCLLVLDPNLFITQTLAPKIQSVTREKFIISAFNDQTDLQVTITDTIKSEAPQKRPLWLLPDYSLGIVLKGETIQNLARKRTFNQLLILLGVDIILLAGLWLIYRNMRRAMKLAEIKSDFVSNVSHEIRTPLALISMFAETLQMGRVPNEDKRKEYYQIIGQEANRLGSIVNKILSFSKLEAGTVTYALEPADLSEIVGSVLETYEYHLKSKGFSWDFQSNGSLPPIAADSDAVSEAVINLLDNALKYSNQSTHIVVSLGLKDDHAYVEVQDFGLGIASDDQKLIYDKFYRVPTGSVHNTKGTGLGLTLVWHIMEAHRGRVELDSTPGKGSKFRLLFPTINN